MTSYLQKNFNITPILIVILRFIGQVKKERHLLH
jgi:hypothetical protein